MNKKVTKNFGSDYLSDACLSWRPCGLKPVGIVLVLTGWLGPPRFQVTGSNLGPGKEVCTLHSAAAQHARCEIKFLDRHTGFTCVLVTL